MQWANAKYEEMLSWAKRAEEKASKSTGRKEPFRKPSFRESDKRGMEGYLAYLTQRDADRRERRRQEALAFRQQLEEQKRKNEEEKERKIRDAAVLEYKSQKKEEEKKAEEARQQSEDLLRELLAKAGVEEDKVGLILKDLASTAHPPIVSLKKAEPLIQSQPETDNHPIPAAVGIRGSVLSRYVHCLIFCLTGGLTSDPGFFGVEQIFHQTKTPSLSFLNQSGQEPITNKSQKSLQSLSHG